MDMLRPVRRLGSAVNGTFGGFFDGMARYGNKGFWSGLGVGILAGIAGGGIGYVMMFAVGGLAMGGALGATVGALKGGYDNVTRDNRRDKYADEVAERESARAAREARSQNGRGRDHRAYYEKRRTVGNYNFERALQQNNENDRIQDTYWQDRVSGGQSNGNGRGY
jgi:hypothetical protein